MVIPRLIKKVKTEKINSGVSDLISGKGKIHRKVEDKKSDLLHLVACTQAHLSMFHMGAEVCCCCCCFDKLRCALLEGLKIKRRVGRVSLVDESQMW